MRSRLNEEDVQLLLLRLGFMEGLALSAISFLERSDDPMGGELRSRLKDFNETFRHPLAEIER